jgi:aryl-alcohol dehydrogenase-like predicted oxidoreductase
MGSIVQKPTIRLPQINRWDESTPVEATLVTLDDAVRRDHVRHTGASSMWAYQFATALHTSDRRGYDRFATMQNHYNLLYREEEREMLPLCAQESVRVLPWSPLARGSLARTHDEREKTGRGKSDTPARRHPYLERGGREINERV